MKKSFTLLFSLLLAFVSTAVAQTVTDISQLSNDKKYTVWTSVRGGWAVGANDDGTLKFKSSNDAGLGTTLDNPMNKQLQFQFINKDNSYYLYSVYAEKYVKKDCTLDKETGDAIELLPQDNGTFVVKFDDSHYINIGSSNQITVDSWSTADAGNKVTIAEANAMVDVTWEYYLDGQLFKTVKESCYPNTDVTAAPIDFYVVDSQSANNTGSDASITIEVKGHEDLPFEKGQWYVMKMHSNNQHYLSVADNAIAFTKVADLGLGVLDDDCYFWSITGSLAEGFHVSNKATGDYISPDESPALSSSGTWELAKSTANSAWFCLKKPDTGNYMNLNLGGGSVAYWTAADAGSSIYFATPASLVIDDLRAWESAPQGAVGYPVALDANQLQATIGNLQGNPFNVAEAKTGAALCEQLTTGETVQLTEGYYRIYNALEGLYRNSKGIYFDGNSFVWGSIDNQHVDHIVKVVPSTNAEKWCLVAPNYNRYMQGVAGAAGESEGENSGFELTPLGFAQYNLSFGNGTMHANNHSNGAGEGSNLVNWGGNAGSASAWYILPANSLDVQLATDQYANGAFAAAYLPFDVAGEGLRVGVLNSDQSVLKLQDVPEVPAQQGFIIEAAANTPSVTLNIVSDAAAIEANDITGTLAPTTLDAGHVFNVGETIGFELSYSAEVGANQAYVTNSQYQGAIFLRDSDGLPTGIGQAQQGGLDSQAPVFDLSGRRVAGTVKGGVYIQNGHKFIVK